MKTPKLLIGLGLILLGAALLLPIGCATGADRAPTRLEQRLFNIETNWYPVVHVVTNTVTVTNTVETVREVERVVAAPAPTGGGIIYTTNVYNLTNTETHFATVTNVVTQTNDEPSYKYNTGATAKVITEAGGAVAAPWGVGGIVTTVLGGIFGVWGTMRSSKANKASETMGQIIETGRELMTTTPQGAILEERWKNWMIQHQAEAGVIQHIAKIVAENVDNEEARYVADRLASAPLVPPASPPPIVVPHP